MNTPTCRTPYRAIRLIVAVLALLTPWFPAASSQAAPLAQGGPITVDLMAVADARTQAGSPDANFPTGFLWMGTPNGHRVYVQFDLSVLPVDATIDAAALRLEFTGTYSGTKDVEVGQVDGAWTESGLTWANQPNITWGGPVQTVNTAGSIDWDVLPLAQAWHAQTTPNHGFGLRGTAGNVLKAAYSKDNSPLQGPRLIITYSLPPDPGNPRPDLGDAPDSSNHHNIINTAYLAGAVAGRFPTVWDDPTGQPAGPRHANQTMEGILGNYLSREAEADAGPDQDGPNNILRHSVSGVVGDVADNDRGDDGWRNRNIKFVDCRKKTLTVRVSKAPNATRKFMVLNVWFDGNRDGDWQDVSPCRLSPGAPAEASYEWIVQDHIIDMTAIPAGGFLDFQVNTERILNDTPGLPHWMRFTLSEKRAVQPGGGAYPDGRGPHPDSAPGSYQFGETEDIFQRPPPQGEDGELILEKRVLDADPSVPYAGEVTYQIRLRHEGGSQPIEAEIRDELPYPLHLRSQVDSGGNVFLVAVESPTGGASPLAANLEYKTPGSGVVQQVVTWEGTLSPNSEIRLSFKVHVHPICGPNQQTETIHNVAQARPIGGSQITAEDTFTALCAGYTTRDIEFEATPRPFDANDPINPGQLPWRGQVLNNHAVPVTLGFFQTAQAPTAAKAGMTGNEDNDPRFLEKITLKPGEKRSLELLLDNPAKPGDSLTDPNEQTITAIPRYCILSIEDTHCPDAAKHPHLIGEAPPLQFTPRPNDLGDAPDSSNHPAAAMTAYPGVMAHFPTVFDPATGLPEGPRHRHPRPLHLGPQVSREAEADLGPDEDGVNNLNPAANVPNLDQFDDGSRLINLAHCQPATAQVQVAVSPQAAAWFGEQNRPAYLNVWLDSNRDGDWADGFTCQDEAGQNHAVVEHILIDFPIDVAALGPGLHNLNNIPTDRIAWPATLLQRPWVRFTLSERESNKTLQFGGLTYGDGRGYPTPFRTGETEDHRLTPPGGEGDGPDVAVRVSGSRKQQHSLNDAAGREAAMLGELIHLKIDLTNHGPQPASRGFGNITLKKGLRPAETLEAQTGYKLKQAVGPGLQPGDVAETADGITINLPELPAGGNNTVLLVFEPSAAARGQIAAEDISANVEVTITGDVNPADNSAEMILKPAAGTPMVGVPLGDPASVWAKRDTTCRSTFDLSIRGEVGQTLDLFLDGEMLTQLSMTADTASYPLKDLENGSHQVFVRDANRIISPRDAASGLPTAKYHVNSSLPIDPMSLTFTDSRGAVIHPPTLSWSWRDTNVSSWLRPGETYEVGLDACSSDPGLAITLMLDDTLLTRLNDHDGDGHYTGSYTPDLAGRQAEAAEATLRFVVSGRGVEQTFATRLATPAPGIIRAAGSNQPLAGANVSALYPAGAATYLPLPAAISSEPNQQVTGADGAYTFTVPNGLYRLDVARDGYQPYHSNDITVDDGNLAVDLHLSPAIDEVAGQIIYITEQSFAPAVVTAKPGTVIMWVNAALDDQAISRAGGWESGLLNSGASYKIKLDAAGTYAYQDSTDPTKTGLIIVQDEDGADLTHQVFLPLVIK